MSIVGFWLVEDGMSNFKLSEDWQAVVLAAIIIVLATLGVLGKNGLNITF